jgi:hypothetical protein
VDAAAMEATTTDTAMEGSGTVKAATAMKAARCVSATATAVKAATTAAACALRERRAGARNGQGRQCANYQSTHFPGCHDRSPSFL